MIYPAYESLISAQRTAGILFASIVLVTVQSENDSMVMQT